MNGLLVIDKPAGMTSRDVVNRVQKWFPRKTKIGHTGTLDPLATGVLVVCIGAATRLTDYVQAMGKTYVSRFRLGATSTTDDADGHVTETPNAVPPTSRADRRRTRWLHRHDRSGSAGSLRGEAAGCSRLRARSTGPEGRNSGRASCRSYSITVKGYEWPYLDVEVDCGKGTYIRSIARDLGDVLGCGGLVQTLRRTRVGPFTAEQGIGLDSDPASIKLLPMSQAVVGLPRITLEPEIVQRLRNGQFVRHLLPHPLSNPTQPIAVFEPSGEFVGTVLPDAHGAIRPAVMIRK